MISVALTGNVAAGKSLVAAAWADPFNASGAQAAFAAPGTSSSIACIVALRSTNCAAGIHAIWYSPAFVLHISSMDSYAFARLFNSQSFLV